MNLIHLILFLFSSICVAMETNNADDDDLTVNFDGTHCNNNITGIVTSGTRININGTWTTVKNISNNEPSFLYPAEINNTPAFNLSLNCIYGIIPSDGLYGTLLDEKSNWTDISLSPYILTMDWDALNTTNRKGFDIFQKIIDFQSNFVAVILYSKLIGTIEQPPSFQLKTTTLFLGATEYEKSNMLLQASLPSVFQDVLKYQQIRIVIADLRNNNNVQLKGAKTWEWTLIIVIILVIAALLTSCALHYHIRKIHRRQQQNLQTEGNNQASEMTESTINRPMDQISLLNIPLFIFHNIEKSYAKSYTKSHITLTDIVIEKLNGQEMEHRKSISISTESIRSSTELCAICLDQFYEDEAVRRLPCKHDFHQLCIDEWLTTKFANCPLCKQNVREVPSQVIE